MLIRRDRERVVQTRARHQHLGPVLAVCGIVLAVIFLFVH
jgi:hypothetical protein